MEFRLLVPDHVEPATSRSGLSASSRQSSNSTLMLAGRNWRLSDPLNIEDPDLPRYVCISYLWGPHREPHAMVSALEMSTHTLPSLASAMQVREQCEAFWTDVFCVPTDEGPARQATLESMGYIYSCATEVVVVLGAETFSVIDDMIQHKVVSEPQLSVLERDDWISSVWTYQETTNSQSLSFVSEVRIDGHDQGEIDSVVPMSIDVTDFFSALGYGLEQYRQRSNSNPFAIVRAFPNLNELENVLADWYVSSFAQRSVYSVLCGIQGKRVVYPENYFYAAFGSLTKDPQQLAWRDGPSEQNLAEKLMQICESKNDYSFIYTVAERDPDRLHPWRPRANALPAGNERVPAVIQPIFPWHFWGEAQRGSVDENGTLWLHNITIVIPVENASMSDTAKQAIVSWLARWNLLEAGVDDATMSNTVLEIIQSVGFRGQGQPIVCPNGLIFPLKPIQQNQVVRIILSNQIRFAAGAPGLIHFSEKANEKEYVPCLFVGAVLQLTQEGETVQL